MHVDLEGPFNVQTGDKFLICSDGLSGPVNDEELGTILRCLEPQEAADTLVDLANLRGGPDNISVVIAQVDGAVPAYRSKRYAKRMRQQPKNVRVRGRCGWLRAPVWQCWHIALPMSFGQGRLVRALVLSQRWVRASPFAHPWRQLARPLGQLAGRTAMGPIGKRIVPPGPKVVAVLAEIAVKLRDLPEEDAGDRSVDWQAFDATASEAQAANDQGDFVSAIQHYSAAIRRMMKQLRQSRPTVDADRI